MGKLAVLALALLLTVLLACGHGRQAKQQAIRNQANAQIDMANAQAARDKRYATCDEPHPPDAHCGLVSPSFFSEATLNSTVQRSCEGLTDDRCRETVINNWLERLMRRYPRADLDRITAFCENKHRPCSEPIAMERLFLQLHNDAVEADRVALNTHVAADADAVLAAERRAQQQKFADALQNFSNSMQHQPTHASRSSNVEPEQPSYTDGSSHRTIATGSSGSSSAGSNRCTSDYGCRSGWKCAKDSLAFSGVCAQAVNEYGTPTYSPPDPASAGPGQGQCSFDTQCPPGFKCEKTSGGLNGNCMK